ncbi:MAG: ribosome biogenesis GTPase Der [Chthoniobacteraceae bacterium]
MPERTVAIVGRPNVGKSALFNRLARRKIAIVHDQPGVTRDRINGVCKLGNAPFTIIDTGGIGGNVDLDFTAQVHAEVDIAIEAADVLLFVVDGQDGVTPVDEELARKLRKGGKPLLLVINKIDESRHLDNTAEFAKLNFETSIPISAEHDRGTGELVRSIEARLPAPPEAAEGEVAAPVKIVIVGRPNVGKSTLTNAILRDERTLVSSIAGTTRDAVDIPYEREGKSYVLIDTAGIRHRSKVSSSVEVFSVMRAQDSIERADLCCLVIDSEAGITSMDKTIAGMIQKAGKPCVVAANKWDLVEEKTRGKDKLKEFLSDLDANLFALKFAPVILCCAKDSVEITRLFRTFEKVRAASRRHLDTGPLNRALQQATDSHPPASQRGRRFKILYATHAKPPERIAVPAPEIVIFCNDGRLLEESYRRYLEASVRTIEPFTGLPIFFRLRSRTPRDKTAPRKRKR